MGRILIGLFKSAIVVDGQFAFRIRLINCRLGGSHEGASLEHDALFNGFVDIAGQGRDQKRCQYGQDDQDNDQFNEGKPSFLVGISEPGHSVRLPHQYKTVQIKYIHITMLRQLWGMPNSLYIICE